MVKLFVNGDETEVSQTNLENFLLQRQSQGKKFAVAVNETFVAKKDYSLIELSDGDQLEIVEPMQGG